MVENYPHLQASSNFFALQDQLEGTENRIAVARQNYNNVTRVFNTKIELFPGNLVSPVFGYTARAFFESKEEALEPVSVEF